MMDKIRRFTSGFVADESGQSLLFCALTIFALIIMVGLIAGVGQVTSNQMKLQSAADASAYAAVAVQADCMAQVALLNEGMAAIYKESMAESVHNVLQYTDAVKAVPWWDPSQVTVAGDSNFFPVPDAYTYDPPASDGSGSCWGAEGDGKGRDWYVNLIKIQRLIAISAPMLIKTQAYQAAHSNFYEPASEEEDGKPLRLALFPAPGSNTNPTWEFYPEEGSYHNAVMVEDPDDAEGWFVYSESDPGYEMTFTHNVIDEATIDNGTFNEWHVVRNTPTSSVDFLIRDTVFDPFKAVGAPSGSSYTGMVYQEGHYVLNINGKEITIDMYSDTNGGDLVLAVVQPSQFDEGRSQDIIEKLENGVRINGKEYLYKDDGGMSIDGEDVMGELTVNGMDIPVSFPGGITAGSGMHFRFVWPLTISMDGMWASFVGGINVHYLFNSAIGWIKGDDDHAVVHTLSTSSPDDRWTWRYGRVGRVQHRMTEYDSERYPACDAFRYEVCNIGAYLEDMPIRKLGVHALMMDGSDSPLPNSLQDSGYVPVNSLPVRYATEERMSTFESDDARFQNYKESVWNLFASANIGWACPQRAPHTSAEATTNYAFGGFFDLSTGQPYNDYAYSVTLETSPYADKMRNWSKSSKLYSGTWILPRLDISGQDLYRYFQDHSTVFTAHYNPLWKLYAKVSRGTAETVPGLDAEDTDTALNDNDLDAQIEIAGDNKFTCGFYVLGPYTDWRNNAEFRDLVNGLGDYVEENLPNITEYPFCIDDGVSFDYPFFGYMRDGSMFLAIWDPYGAAASYVNQPRYPDPNMHGYYEKDANAELIKWKEEFKPSLSTAPARVRRYIYHGKGLYNLPTNSNDYLLYAMGIDINALEIGEEMVKPLQATSQIFRMPVVAVAWSPELSSSVDKIFGRSEEDSTEAQKNLGQFNPLMIADEDNTRKWNYGHFAYAAARVFMRTPGEDSSFIANFGYCGGSFDDRSTAAGTQSTAALDFPNEVDQVTNQRMSGYRQRWLESSFNLFEPVWSAALVSMKNSLKLEDVVPDSEIIAEDDTATAFLMRTFRSQALHTWSGNGGWIKDAYQDYYGGRQDDRNARRAWLRISAPPMQGGNVGDSVNWKGDSGSFDDVVLH